MNEKRLIIAIYAVTFSAFNFICWIIVSNIVLNIDLFILNVIFIVVNIVFIYKNSKRINYNECRDKIIKRIYALVLIGIGILIFKSNFMTIILRGELIFFIAGIWLLRAVRRYSQGISSRKYFVYDLILMAFIALLSYDKLLNLIIRILGFLLEYISVIFDKIAYIISLIIGYPITALTNLLGTLYEKHTNQIADYLKPSENKDTITNISNISGHSTYVSIFIKVLLVLVLVIIIFKSVMRAKDSEKADATALVEVREKIRGNETGASKNFTEIFDFIVSRDIKSQILHTYKNFQKKAMAKQLYKASMTAKELSEEVSKLTKEELEVKELSNIYNKAKFSKDIMDKEELIRVKNSYNIIKKEI